ncbi:MAG: diguanylate cyclase domain-containing protein [Chthoniobacterales bacterium]
MDPWFGREPTPRPAHRRVRQARVGGRHRHSERALHAHCARTHDVIVRRAHDEYVAVLPDTPPAGARHVGEQLVDAMRAEDTDHTHRVSVGVAVAVPDDHRDPADLLRRAESALQAAQDNGGDRCAGGTAASAGTGAKPQGVLTALGGLFKKKGADEASRRRTD